jgi:hypothetical protein
MWPILILLTVLLTLLLMNSALLLMHSALGRRLCISQRQQREKPEGRSGHRRRYSLCFLYWYKYTNTDAMLRITEKKATQSAGGDLSPLERQDAQVS